VVLIGLLLILVAIAAAAWLVIGTQSLTTPIDLDTPGFHVSATPLALLIAGAAVLFVLWLGLAAIRGSVKRRRRPAREAKEAQRQAEFEENIRADERARSEETHQGVMAERDRVREEEFSAKLDERDRIRDADERTRLAEHEQRVRADERSKVEEEHSRRNAAAARTAVSTAGAGVAGAAGAGAAGVGAAGVGGGAVPDLDRAADGGDADDTAREDRTARQDDAGRDDDVSRRSLDDVDDEGGDRYQTVADQLMGRGPTGRD